MGLTITDAVNIISCIGKVSNESVLCLGEQTLGFSTKDLLDSKKKYGHSVNLEVFNKLDGKQKLNQKLFFATLGYEKIDTLDVDDYEGANIVFDLNKDKTPNNLKNQYDFIYDGGTLEHIFNIGNALKHLTNMTKDKGLIFHSNPCNGFIDHGFFQISPTLYFDYYLRNEFEILYAGIIDKSIGRKSFPVRQDLYRTLDMNFGPKYTPKGVINFCAQKQDKIEQITDPQQGYYISTWSNNKQKKYLVKNHVSFHNLKFIRHLLQFWNKIPYSIIELLKSIK
jgi:hypothetical protein